MLLAPLGALRAPELAPKRGSKRALRRGHRIAFDLHRVAQCARDTLERRLDDVVAILSGHRTHVQRDTRAVDESLPELLGELRIEGADPLRDRVDVVDEI